MGISNVERATILSHAMPYIQKYTGKTVVIKYGGSAMINEDLKNAVISDIVLLSLVGIKVVLVHGGGPEINDLLKKVGKEPKFINGLRYTDEETIDYVQMVLCGKVNKDLVAKIIQNGGRAVGLCGLDDHLFTAKKYTDENGTDYGFVGDIINVNSALVSALTKDTVVPIIATVATGESGEVYNINADTAAAQLAVSLNAEKLILLTDVKGVMKDPTDETSLINVIHPGDVNTLKAKGVITGGMIPKIECCIDAIKNGVLRAHIIDGTVPHSILIEMFTDEGIGTMFCY